MPGYILRYITYCNDFIRLYLSYDTKATLKSFFAEKTLRVLAIL